jgi:hypothetical protein
MIPNRRTYIRNIAQEADEAKRIRETFTDRSASKVQTMRWQWPKRMHEVGQCVAVMYSSDKWRNPGEYEDYKHVAEDEQLLFVKPGLLVDEDGDELDLVGPTSDLNGEMPQTIAVLAPIIGIQMRLYVDEGEGHYLPNEGNLYQVTLPKAMLGAALHPDTGEKFLVVYSPSEVLCIITGSSLDVLHDGIVG